MLHSSSYPGAHPEPSLELPSIPLPLILEQEVWFRFHRAGREPLFFGRTGMNRFDAPDAQFGTLYLGDSPHCCFVETYGRTDREAQRIVTHKELAERSLTTVEFNRSLRVVDLSGPGLANIGADNRLSTGDYRIAQRWSHALWSHPDEPDGLLYRSRHDPSRRCLALFDRSMDAAVVRNTINLIERENLDLLSEILDAYHFGYLD